MHDKEFENGILRASNGINEGNDGGYISRVMNTSKNTKLVFGAIGRGQVTQFSMSSGGDATSWPINGHDCRSCDEGGEQCHED